MDRIGKTIDKYYSRKTLRPFVAIRPPVMDGQPLSLNDAKRIVQAIGETRVDGFVVDEHNREVYTKLTQYFIGSKDFTGTYQMKCKELGVNEYDYSLSKGVLIMGIKGSGKTIAMEIFKDFSHIVENGVKMKRQNAKAIEDMFKLEQYPYLMRYKQSENWYFDDIGEESPVTCYYNDKVVLFNNILTDVYNNWQNIGSVTFATTNLNAQLIYNRYGEGIYERLGQMYNIFSLTGKNRRTNGK